MPIFWILVVGVLLYLALQQMEKQYSLKNKKPSAETPPPVKTDAAAPPVETDAAAPPVETDAAAPPVETDAAAPPVETEPDPEESTDGTPFIDTIPGLPQETKQELQQLNLTTASSISDTSDKKLLAIKGIGPARLKQIRSLCADIKD